MKFQTFKRGIQAAAVRYGITRGAYILSLSIGLGYVLCIGPSLQLYLLSLLKSPEVGIYASTYGESLIKFPDLNTWLFNTNALMFPLLSLPFSIFIATKSRLPRDIFVVSTAYFFTVLCLSDAALCFIFVDPKNPINFYECLVSDAIGSPLIAGCVILALRFNDGILGFSKSNLPILKTLATAMPALAGILLHCSAYYICAIFFNPTASRIEVLVKPATTGLYVDEKNSATLKKSKPSPEESQFGILTKPTRFNGEFGAISPQKSVKVEWQKPMRPEKYTATVRFYSGCGDIKVADNAGAATPETFPSVESLAISTDDGPTQLSINSNSSDLATINVPNSKGDFFWFDQDSKTKEVTLARFTNGESPISYASSTDKMRIFVLENLAKIDAMRNIHLTARHAQLKVNNVTYDLSLSLDKNFDLNSKSPCKILDRAGPLRAGTNALSNIDGVLGLLIDIEPSSPTETLYNDRKNVMLIKNFAGWVSVSKLSASDASQMADSGKLGAILFRGDVDTFKLNESKIDATPFDIFVLQGEKMQGTLEPSGVLHLQGTADQLWKNQIRLNPTRWEQLDTAVKLLLLSAAMTIFSSLFYGVASTLKKNERLKSL